IVIKMSIPGIQRNEVTVECNGDVITICGVRKGVGSQGVRRYHQMEIRNGYFERRIVIRRPFDPNGATARYEDGFLYVTIPKSSQPVQNVLHMRLRF
ncbi:MAG: Hsp20/alpha crystallin family protein, partial [Planctomycetota bacterium]